MSSCRIEKQAHSYWKVLAERRSVIETPWQLDLADQSLSELEAVNILQYLTTMEADLALLNWFHALSIGGRLSIVVPDSNYYLKMWQEAEWSEDTLRDPESAARASFRMLWGEQRGGNPRNADYCPQHSDVFKSAYNENRMSFLLERAGFVEVVLKNDQKGTLSVNARKSMNKGERQIANSLVNIRSDHKNRYHFACRYLAPLQPFRILDLACGIGYGSLILSETGARLTSVDIDPGAIDYARQYFSNAQIDFVCEDARNFTPSAENFDAVVSFETIEHVSFDKALVEKFYRALKPRGILICSTPNQEIMPFDKEKFAFHLRHYTNAELLSLLQEAGFTTVELFSQKNPTEGEVVPGEDGHFTIAVARK